MKENRKAHEEKILEILFRIVMKAGLSGELAEVKKHNYVPCSGIFHYTIIIPGRRHDYIFRIGYCVSDDYATVDYEDQNGSGPCGIQIRVDRLPMIILDHLKYDMQEQGFDWPGYDEKKRRIRKTINYTLGGAAFGVIGVGAVALMSGRD